MRPAPGLDHVVAGQDIAPIITSDVRPTSSVVSMILRGSFCCLYPFNGSLVENRIWACTTNLEAPDGPVNWRSPRRDAPPGASVTARSGAILNLHHHVRLLRRGISCFVCGKLLFQDFATRTLRVRHVNGKIRNAIDALHQLKHRYTFNDYGTRQRKTSFDDAIYLEVEMSEVILRRDQEKISLDQRHIEVPGKVTSKSGLSDAIASINRDDDARKPSHDPCQGLHDLQIAWKNGGQDDA